MARFLAVLEYDGTGFRGSQIQPGERTVQGELERALEALSGNRTVTEGLRTVLSGRTDSGVHACGQVAAFDVARFSEAGRVLRALNGLLPSDLSVREVALVPDAFHPRYWAQARRYCYRILNRLSRCALMERYTWHVATPLDVKAMHTCGQVLLGQHEFGGFGRPPVGSNSVRRINRLEVVRDGALITVVIEADAFLRRMARLIVGALVDIGRGKLSVDSIVRRLHGLEGDGEISSAAPAKGLFLDGVAYDRERLGYGCGIWWSCESLLPN